MLLSNTPSTEKILEAVEVFEEDNLATIAKFKKKKQIEIKRINGAIKQTLQAHPVITKELTGSLSKRIYGALLTNKNEVKESKRYSIKSILIGFILGLISSLVICLI